MSRNKIDKNLSKAVLANHLDYFLENSSDCIYWKDSCKNYLGINPFFSKLTQLSEDKIIGASDFDMPWAQQATDLQTNDDEIMQTATPKCYVEKVQNVSGRFDYFKSYKYPLTSRQGKVIGIVGCSVMCNDELLLKSVHCRNSFIEVLSASKSANHLKLPLTRMQSDCLFWTMRGMTMKETARVLKLSPRTVEHYMEIVKSKLNCQTRSQLTEKVLQLFSEHHHLT